MLKVDWTLPPSLGYIQCLFFIIATTKHCFSKIWYHQRNAVWSNVETMKQHELVVHVVSSIAVFPLKIVNILQHHDFFVVAIWGASAHSLGTIGLKQSVTGSGRSTSHDSGEWNVEESILWHLRRRFVSWKPTHERCLGGKPLALCCCCSVCLGVWNCSCHLGPVEVTIPRRTLRLVEGNGVGPLDLMTLFGCHILEVPTSELPVVWANAFLESLTCLELDFLFTCRQNPSCYSSKRCLENCSFSFPFRVTYESLREIPQFSAYFCLMPSLPNLFDLGNLFSIEPYNIS